ncbi:MAG: hypothetical protein ABJN69_08825 [Hellea sp.]
MKSLSEAFVLDSAMAIKKPMFVEALDQEIVRINRSNIEDYPDEIGPLSAKSWDTSICVCRGNSWEVLVDLVTLDGEISDLVMHAKIVGNGNGYVIEPGLIYVP